MKTAFHTSFTKDLRAIKDQTVRDRVAKLIQTVEVAADLAAIPNLKRCVGRAATTGYALENIALDLLCGPRWFRSFAACIEKKFTAISREQAVSAQRG